MTIKEISVSAGLWLCIIVSVAITLLLPFATQKVSAALPRTPENDLNRRILVTLKQCLSAGHLDIYDGVSGDDNDDDVEDFNDYFRGLDEEKIVVGFDRDKTNGTQSCSTVLGNGIRTFAQLKDNQTVTASFEDGSGGRRYFLNKLTGQDSFVRLEENGGCDDGNPDGGFSTCFARNNAIEWIGEIDGILGQFESPKKVFTSSRLAKLTNTCFDITDTSSTERAFNNDQDMRLDISVAGATAKTYYFYRKSASEIQDIFKEPGGWVRLNGGNFSATDAEVGNIELDFSGQRGDVNDYNADDSDFFPFGSDLPSFTSGHVYGDAFLDCEFINQHSDFVAEGVVGINVEKNSIIYDTDGDGRLSPEEEAAASLISGSLSTEDDNSCESKGGIMGWIMCPVVNTLDGIFNKIDTLIQGLLIIDKDKFRDDDLEIAWKRTRDLSYIILIPIMLVMVISTALGFEFISAYTVKKALPRMVAAVIFIALSWELTGFLIELTNNIGQGVLGVITQPFNLTGSSDGLTLQDLFAPSAGGAAIQVTGAVGATILGIGATLFSPALLGLLINLLFGAVLIMLTAFMVLIARQLFVIALMLFAPLAILSWIFPGNDKLWKLWWGTFSKMLMMYPLIMALVASGRVFAFVLGHANSSGPEGAIFNPIMKLVAYVVPYAMIPLTFKFAGGLLGNIANVSKGLGERNRKRREAKLADVKSSARSGDLFKNRSIAGRQLGGRYGAKIASRTSRMAQGASLGYKGKFGLGTGADRAQDAALATEAAALMKTDMFAAESENDHVLRATASGTTRAEAIANMQSTFGYSAEEAKAHVLAAEKTTGLGKAQQVAAAQQLVNTGTGYDDVHQMKTALAIAAGGNRQTASRLAGFANSTTKKVGRNDLAPGFSNLDAAVRGEMGAQYLDEGETLLSDAELLEAGWKSGGLYTHANGKPRSLDNLLAHLDSKHAAAVTSGNYSDQVEAEISRLELKEMLKNSTGDNADRINAAIEAMDGRPGFVAGVTAAATTRARVFERETGATATRRDT